MKVFITLLLTVTVFLAEAQKDPYKFGVVTKQELAMKSYEPDPSAAAVILFDKAYSNITVESNTPLTFRRHIRIKLFRKEAFDEWANKKIKVERGNFSKLKGVTYNLEGDSIVRTEIDDNSIFKTRFNKYIDEIKFTLPNVKEGSVIEYSYVIRGDGLPSWEFQHTIPTVYSEYAAYVPMYIAYKSRMKGSIPLTKQESKNNVEKWIMTDVPAFKSEPLMPNEDDFISSIYFSFSRISWVTLGERLWQDEDFGGAIEGFPFLNKKVEEITAGLRDPKQKVMAIYKYVKDNLTWNEIEDIYAEDLKEAFKQKKGTAADINLALASMLHKAGIPVEMVLLSTRGNGFVRMDLPTIRQFNYTICMVHLDTVAVFLDATEKYLPWNVLPERCLNGLAFAVSKGQSQWVSVYPTTNARTVVSADLALNDQGILTGKLTYNRDGYAAYEMRTAYHDQGEENYLRDAMKNSTWKISKSEFSNIDNIEKPASEVHQITLEEHGTEAGDLIYINPFVTFKLEKNPFQAETRRFPIDLVVGSEKIYLSNITIPDNYTVEELPPPKIILLPEKAGKFTYNITRLGNRLTVVSSIQINKPIFMQDKYQYLRDLYSMIIAKHDEQIVLRKK